MTSAKLPPQYPYNDIRIVLSPQKKRINGYAHAAPIVSTNTSGANPDIASTATTTIPNICPRIVATGYHLLCDNVRKYTLLNSIVPRRRFLLLSLLLSSSSSSSISISKPNLSFARSNISFFFLFPSSHLSPV